MSAKTYVLLDHTNSSAEVYQQLNAHQRVRLTKRPNDHAYGQITFMDRDGTNKTIRLCLDSNEIYQDKQIKELLIPANRKYTQSERDALMFRDGVLVTTNETVQRYLETSPQFEDFWVKDKDGKVGNCPDIRGPLYKILDKTVELKNESAMFRKRVAAANKIMALKTVQEGQELMYRLNGSFFKAPDDMLEIEAELIRFVDEADEPMLNAFLKEDVNLDEKTTVLIGKAIGLGILSFDKVPDQVVKVKGQKVTPLKEISSDHLPEERKRYFSEFLTSNDGKLLLQDLEKEIAAAEKKAETVTA